MHIQYISRPILLSHRPNTDGGCVGRRYTSTEKIFEILFFFFAENNLPLFIVRMEKISTKFLWHFSIQRIRIDIYFGVYYQRVNFYLLIKVLLKKELRYSIRKLCAVLKLAACLPLREYAFGGRVAYALYRWIDGLFEGVRLRFLTATRICAHMCDGCRAPFGGSCSPNTRRTRNTHCSKYTCVFLRLCWSYTYVYMHVFVWRCVWT